MIRALRIASRALLGLVGVLVLLVAVVYGVSEARFRTRFDAAAADLSLVSNSTLIARGEHIVAVRGCAECHGTDMGGKTMMDDPAIGRISGSNLTSGRGGVAGQYPTGADWDRALRHGIAADGHSLLLMPSQEYAALSDTDVQAVVAYLRARPPVDRETPSQHVGPVGRALFVAGQIPLIPAAVIDHATVGTGAPPEGPTAAYGAYLAAACSGCHGATFAGGPLPGEPAGSRPAANLTPDRETGLGAWSAADFSRVLRTGVRPDGRALDPSMPIGMTKPLTETETAALWAFFRSLPPVRTPGA